MNEEALATARQTHGPTSPAVADLLNSLGVQYSVKRETVHLATPLLAEALRISRQLYPAHHPKCVRVCSCACGFIARVLRRGSVACPGTKVVPWCMRDRVLAITRNLADTYAAMDRPDLTEPLLVELAKGGGTTGGGGGSAADSAPSRGRSEDEGRGADRAGSADTEEVQWDTPFQRRRHAERVAALRALVAQHHMAHRLDEAAEACLQLLALTRGTLRAALRVASASASAGGRGAGAGAGADAQDDAVDVGAHVCAVAEAMCTLGSIYKDQGDLERAVSALTDVQPFLESHDSHLRVAAEETAGVDSTPDSTALSTADSAVGSRERYWRREARMWVAMSADQMLLLSLRMGVPDIAMACFEVALPATEDGSEMCVLCPILALVVALTFSVPLGPCGCCTLRRRAKVMSHGGEVLLARGDVTGAVSLLQQASDEFAARFPRSFVAYVVVPRLLHVCGQRVHCTHCRYHSAATQAACFTYHGRKNGVARLIAHSRPWWRRSRSCSSPRCRARRCSYPPAQA